LTLAPRIENEPAGVASWARIAQKTRVPAGTLLGIIFLFLMHPSRRSLWLGVVIAIAGALLRVWAAGYIDKGRKLAVSGPYARTRNPLYLGSFFMALGIIIAGQGYWLLLPFAIFFLGFYYPVMKVEEQELLNGHGDEFHRYARTVPFFFPRLTISGAHSARFLWSRVVKNREHRTVLGLLLAVSFLILRAML
jgi:protein-S-isoprenylcysteine O-methyltransferase Ste14